MMVPPPVAKLGPTPGLIRPGPDRARLGGANVGLFCEFEALEPERPATPRTLRALVEPLNRDDALLMAGYLNCVTSGSGTTEDFVRQQAAYAAVFHPGDAAKIDAWIRKKGFGNRTTLFFRGQLLEVMRWVARYGDPKPGNGMSFLDLDTRRRFVRAAFLAGELWSRRIYADKLTGFGTPEEALDRALSAFRKGVEDSSPALHIGVALARSKFLFEDHMPRQLNSFRTDFEAATGLTIEEYILASGMLMVKVVDKPTDGYFFRPSYARQTAFGDKFDRFLAAASQDAESLAQRLWADFDRTGYRPLRERPVLMTSSGQCVVLDPGFFVDYFTIAPVFKVVRGTGTQAAMAAFGRAFEDYAVSILKRIYPSGSYLCQRLYTEVTQRPQDPAFTVDALINDADELVIAELKTAFIPEEAVTAPDPAAFLQALRKRYGVSGDPKDREVGVAQVAKCVRAIVLEGWSQAAIKPEEVKRIFPVLLVHDERMGSPGVGQFLNRLFGEQLGEIGKRVRVAPLAVMTIQDLENLESSGIALRELLSAYAARSNGGIISIHNFMATDEDFRLRIRPNETLMGKSYEIVEQMRDRLFPAQRAPVT